MSDEEIEKELWKSAVPVEFVLAETDISRAEKPPPFFRLIPRVSYIPFYLRNVRDHFADARAVGGTDTEIWVEYRGVPLKWHLPMGVLFDLICASNEDESHLPLQLVVHFQNFPADRVLNLKTEKDVVFFFQHSLKEAVYVKYSNVKSIMTLSTSDQTELCEAVRDCNHDVFTKIRQVIDKSADGQPQRVPVHLFVADLQRGGLPEARMLFKAVDRSLSFGRLLHLFLPEEFGPDQDGDDLPRSLRARARVLMHGVTPLCSTPVGWLAGHCCHPDFFVNVVVAINLPSR
eukprot:TRINITY_DN3498_c0_g1_i1.p1 TRINITY_DN3498_c0_g1~~TRINITY_DN3498_c0_g1_i1.p1  ORF type:complete len:333 (+),score=78.94 TRINITY_DN3498_c0_g1_i1:133-999(+)